MNFHSISVLRLLAQRRIVVSPVHGVGIVVLFVVYPWLGLLGLSMELAYLAYAVRDASWKICMDGGRFLVQSPFYTAATPIDGFRRASVSGFWMVGTELKVFADWDVRLAGGGSVRRDCLCIGDYFSRSLREIADEIEAACRPYTSCAELDSVAPKLVAERLGK